uniref:Fanconi anemia group M protein homolog n=1 Tax=Phallusia mammillata TaxID=59560 RepID=A0A6F9DD70_9ASCI|nr:Fanconi anemia group M protein homolog [Phallusia mammillata]
MKQAKTKKSTRKMNCFLDDEAEVSVDAELMSSDEDIYGEEWDEEMMQFVNDATQLTQNVAADETAPDVHAMYLKSIQSPLSKQNKPSDVANFKGKYKLAYGKGCDIDVFSQVY